MAVIRPILQKRYYILFVARDEHGELKKINIPLPYVHVFAIGLLVGLLSLTGIVGSYTRMLQKVTTFNQVRSEREDIRNQYSKLEQVSQQRDLQVASLGSLASEVSAIYGLKSDPFLSGAQPKQIADEQVASSLQRFRALRSTAMSGATTLNIGLDLRGATLSDWTHASSVPSLWPVEGVLTGSFGQREDPFSGEGAFHRGVDISVPIGTRVIAAADGVIAESDFTGGYGRCVTIDHGNGVTTRYGHLSAFVVNAGQPIRRGDTIGYSGSSGRSTGPHLHYEVRINDVPVNPYKYLRNTFAQNGSAFGGG